MQVLNYLLTTSIKLIFLKKARKNYIIFFQFEHTDFAIFSACRFELLKNFSQKKSEQFLLRLLFTYLA